MATRLERPWDGNDKTEKDIEKIYRQKDNIRMNEDDCI